jgi:hypothetical protein
VLVVEAAGLAGAPLKAAGFRVTPSAAANLGPSPTDPDVRRTAGISGWVFTNSSSPTGSISLKHFSEARRILQVAVKVVHVSDVFR